MSVEGTEQDTLVSDTEIIKGDPGAGKTYELIQRIKTLYSDGYWGTGLRIVTFNKTSVEDFKSRLEEHEVTDPYLPDEEMDLRGVFGDSVSTMHSMCLSLSGVGDDDYSDIITMDDDPEYFEEFFDRVDGVGFDGDGVDPEAKLSEDAEMDDVGVGNKIIAAYNYVRCQGSGWELKHHTHDSVPVEIEELPHYRVTEIMQAWEDYKTQKDLYQHHDYVRYVRDNELVPECEVLIVDEFQDFNPLLYEVFRVWKQGVEKTIISGDPKQSIYSFFGSSPKYFRDVDGKETRRSTSRRCPENIVSVSRNLLKPTSHDVSDMAAHDPEGDRDSGVVRDVRLSDDDTDGVVELAESLYNRHDDGEEWEDGEPARRVMLLARSRRGMHILADALEQSDVPYQAVRRGDIPWWDPPAPQIYRLLTAYQNGNGVSTNLARFSLPFFDAVEETDAWEMAVEDELDRYGNDRISYEELEATFGGLEAEMVADKLLNAERELKNVRGEISWVSDRSVDVVRKAFKSEYDNMPGEIRVGTIHSSKGLEADSVVLSTAYSRKMRERYELDEDGGREEEHRLFFVGASRARSELVALHGYHGSTEFPPLEEGVEKLVEG